MQPTPRYDYDTLPTGLLTTDTFLLAEPLSFPPQTMPSVGPSVRVAATVTSESELLTAISANNSPINVAADFTVSSVITISGSRDIIIQSLGATTYTISRAANFSSTYMFFVYAGSSLTLRNIALNGMAYPSYTILANLGSVTVEDGTTIYNSGAGGVVNQGTMLVTGGIFEQNTSSGGGGIFNSNSGTLTVSGGIFRNNNVTLYGGGIYSNNATLIVSGGEFTENTAGRNGAGLCLVNSTTGSIYGSTYIHHNVADETGGGVTIQNSDVEIFGDVQITQNSAPNYGGGVYSHTTTGRFSNIAIYDRVNISQNVAGSGGGIFVFYLNDINIYGNVTINQNNATQVFGNGGGLMLYDQAEGTLGGNASIQYNTAYLSGGGVFIRQANFAIGPASSDTPIIAYNIAANGGGLVAAQTPVNLLVSANTTINNNSATDRGGGISVTDEAVVTVAGNTQISGNTAENSGGGAFLLDATLQLAEQANISGNTAPQGSGIANFGHLLVRDSIQIHRVYLNGPPYLLELSGPLIGASISFEPSAYVENGTTPIIVAHGGTAYPVISTTDANAFIPPFNGYGSVVYDETQIAFVLLDIVIQFDANTPDTVQNLPETIVTTPGLITLPSQILQRLGYEFTGWSLQPGGGSLFQPGQTVSVTESLVFYAQWRPQVQPVPPETGCRCCRCCCCCQRHCCRYRAQPKRLY